MLLISLILVTCSSQNKTQYNIIRITNVVVMLKDVIHSFHHVSTLCSEWNTEHIINCLKCLGRTFNFCVALYASCVVCCRLYSSKVRWHDNFTRKYTFGFIIRECLRFSCFLLVSKLINRERFLIIWIRVFLVLHVT